MSDVDTNYQAPSTDDISVIVCAYTEERWQDVVAAVDSVRGQARPPGEITLVIDHNPALFEQAIAHFSDDVKVVENIHRKGLSGARNTGIEATSKDIVAFLDDDAVAQPGWLAEMVRAYDRPEVVGSGGFIAPAWQSARPRWWPAEFDWVVGCSYVGQPARRSFVRNPIGANMSVRRAAFQQVGGFNPSLGRVGKHPVGAEETELFIRIHRLIDDAKVVYEPRSGVLHKVGRSRANFRYFRRRCYAEGLSKAIVSKLGSGDKNLGSEWAYTLKTLPLGVLRNLLQGLKGDRGGLGRASAIISGLLITTVGYLRGRAIKEDVRKLTEIPVAPEHS